jgi:hypothetical protein
MFTYGNLFGWTLRQKATKFTDPVPDPRCWEKTVDSVFSKKTCNVIGYRDGTGTGTYFNIL